MEEKGPGHGTAGLRPCLLPFPCDLGQITEGPSEPQPPSLKTEIKTVSTLEGCWQDLECQEHNKPQWISFSSIINHLHLQTMQQKLEVKPKRNF